MLERFVKQTKFTSQEDFIKNFKSLLNDFGADAVASDNGYIFSHRFRLLSEN